MIGQSSAVGLRERECMASASAGTCVSPSPAMAMTLPPRARTSCDVADDLLVGRLLAESRGASTTTGMFSSISAIGPCFISPRGVALGVDVGDLLELERALERDRVAEAAAEEEHVACACDELARGLLITRASYLSTRSHERRHLVSAWRCSLRLCRASVPRRRPRQTASR